MGEHIFSEGLARYISPAVQQQLAEVRVGIAGAGGLGSNCAMLLVRSGFKRLRIVDWDRVEASNLNRQFYFLHQIGAYKVDALAHNLQWIAPDVCCETLVERVCEENVAALFQECDVIVEAFDDPASKQLLVSEYLRSGKLLVAASGLAGSGGTDLIRTRKLRDQFVFIGDLETAVSVAHPPLAPRVMVAAAKQADAVLDYYLRRHGV